MREGVTAAGVPGHQVSNTKPCGLALANTQSPYHLHVTNLHPPPPRIVLQGCFTQHAQNRATNARFWVFGLNPTPRLRVGERAAPLASPCHPLAPTISHHRPTPPFRTARPKPSYKHSVSGFWPKPHPRLCIGKRAAPLASPCHPPAPAISHHRPTPPFRTARPKPSYKCSVSGFWPKPHPWLRIGERAAPLVEIFPPPGHTGVWCSGNTPSSALCNEESCGSIPSTSDSFYENSNMADVRRNLPFTISGHGDTHTVAVIPTLT